MRHVPPLTFILSRIEHEYGRRLGILAESLDRSEGGETKGRALDAFHSACRWMLRAAECGSHRRLPFQAAVTATETAQRTIATALEELRKIDVDVFRKRMPYHRFQRSEGESVYSAFTAIPYFILRCAEEVAHFDGDIHEHLLAHPVELERLGPMIATPA